MAEATQETTKGMVRGQRRIHSEHENDTCMCRKQRYVGNYAGNKSCGNGGTGEDWAVPFRKPWMGPAVISQAGVIQACFSALPDPPPKR